MDMAGTSRLRVSGQLNWLEKGARSSGDQRDPLPGYTMVDVTARYSGALDFGEVAFGIRNLLDEDAREPTMTAIPGDLPLAGRQLFVDLRARF